MFIVNAYCQCWGAYMSDIVRIFYARDLIEYSQQTWKIGAVNMLI